MTPPSGGITYYEIAVSGVITGKSNYQFTFSNTQNAPSAINIQNQITCRGETSTATLIGTSVTNQNMLTYTPQTITGDYKSNLFILIGITITPQGTAQNGAQGQTWSIYIPIMNNFLANGKIIMTIPKQEQYYLTSGATILGSFGCSVISSVVAIGVAYDTLTIQSQSATIGTTTGTLTVTITGVTNPPSLRAFGSISIFTGDSSGNFIDTSANLLVQTSTKGDYNSAQSSVTISSSTLVSDPGDYTFQLELSNPHPYGTYFQITFDPAITVPSGTLTANCLLNCIGSYTSTIVSSAYRFSGMLSTTYLSANEVIQFDISGFKNPPSQTSAKFYITSYEQTTAGIAYAVDYIGTLSIKPDPGTITISSILPTDNYRIYETPSSYTIAVTPQNQVDTTYKLILTFPSDFTISNGQCTVTQLNSGYTCSSSSTSRTITISNFVNSLGTAGTTYTFTVNMIKNPGSYSKPGTVTAVLQTSTGDLVASGSYSSFTTAMFTQSFIEAFSVTPQNTNAGAYPVTYSFTIRPRARVQMGSSIQITFPDSVTFPAGTYIEVNPVLGFTNTKLSYKQRDQILEVTKGFSNSASTDDPPTLTFTVLGIRNPRTSQTTSNFLCTMYDSSGDTTYAWNSTYSVTVTMQGATTPAYISYTRDSQQNGALTNYYWTVRLTNYYQTGDVIILTAPSTVSYSESTKCIGKSILSYNLICSVSPDLQTVNINVDNSRLRRMLGTIDSGSTIQFELTNVYNPPSLQPSSSSFSYQVRTSNGYQIEVQTTGLTVTNTLPGTISYTVSGVQPSNFIQNEFANYTIKFIPKNFQQRMSIVVTVPSQLKFPSTGQVQCIGIAGVDTSQLTCTTDINAKTITITNAFTYQKSSPSNVTFIINSLQNPSTKALTDSFQIQTFNTNNFAIDELRSNLTINFVCNYPCKTCSLSDPDQCQDCYASVKEKWLLNNKCMPVCPVFYYGELQNNTCIKCFSPCSTCQDKGDSCTSCIDGYEISGTTCIQTVASIAKQKSRLFYFFPFLACGVFFFFLTLIALCCSKYTLFRESAISLIALPEILSWVCMTYLFYFYFQDFLLFLIAGGALALHVLYNWIYSIVYQCKIKSTASKEYRQFLDKYHGCNAFTLFLAFLITFKIHHLTLSRFCGGQHLAGSFNNEGWRTWNGFALAYILTSYAGIMASCILFYLKNFDSFGTLIYLGFFNLHYVVIEVAALSTFVAILLLVGICKTCSSSHVSPIKPKMFDDVSNQVYNYVADEPSGSQDDSDVVKKKQVRRKKIQEQEIVEDDIEINKNRKRTKIDIDLELTDEEPDETVRNPLTGKDNIQNLTVSKEIDMLNSLTQQLKEERELLRDERKMMLKERKRLMNERQDQHNQFQSLQQELKEDRKYLREDKEKLDNKREQFLQEMENRIQKKLEDWDTQSIGSARTKYLKQNFTDMSIYQDPDTQDQSMQTIKKKNEVNFNVQVGFENENQLKQRMKQEKSKKKPIPNDEIFIQDELDNSQQRLIPIKEERDESDEELKQILFKADQLLQQETPVPIQPAPKLPKSVYEKSQIYERTLESKPEFNMPKIQPEYKKDQNLNREIIGQTETGIQPLQPIIERENNMQREKDQTQQNFYNPQQPVFGQDDGTRERMATEQDQFDRQNAVFSRSQGQRERQATQQNFFDNSRAIYSRENDTREKTTTQQEFYNRDQAVFSRGQHGFEKQGTQQEFFNNENAVLSFDKRSIPDRNGTPMEYIDRDKAIFSRENQDRMKQTTQQDFFEKDKPVYGIDDDQREKLQSQQNFYSPDKPEFGIDDGQREKTGSQQNFYQPGQPEFGQDDGSREKRATQQEFYNKSPPAFGIQSDTKSIIAHEETLMQDTNPIYDRSKTSQLGPRTKEQNENYTRAPTPMIENRQYNMQNDEEKRTDANESLDEIQMNEPDKIKQDMNKNIEAEDLDKDRDFAKKKKKVLYSDKSESSIDEMMEDTPSNYNIPNGRLDGKSLGLKALLLHAKKYGIKLPLSNSPPEMDSGRPEAEQTQHNSTTPNLLQKGRLGIQPKMQEEEEKRFVNNLFRDGPLNTNNLQSNIAQSPDLNRLTQGVRPRNTGLESGNENGASWRAFNQPVGKQKPMIVGENTMTIPAGLSPDQHTLEGIEEKPAEGRKKKKKKVVNTTKQFKEPPVNQERIKALESAYMTNQQNNGYSSSSRPSQMKNQVLQNQSALPKINAKSALDDQNMIDRAKLMKNNFI